MAIQPKARLVPATLVHAAALAPVMREEDVEEVRRALGVAPLVGLAHSLRVSTMALSLVAGDEVLAMCGAAKWMEIDGVQVANVWLLTGKSIVRYRKAFMRASRFVVPWMLETYPLLLNFVDARYAAALRWAKWLGFTVGEAVPYGVDGSHFHAITIGRAEWEASQAD